MPSAPVTIAPILGLPATLVGLSMLLVLGGYVLAARWGASGAAGCRCRSVCRQDLD